MSFFGRFSEAYDPPDYDRPSPSEYADLEPGPVLPPCGGPCRPEGCWAERCWMDRDEAA